ncbi:MAG: DoxX family protein [Akkermansiaceae bacterium]
MNKNIQTQRISPLEITLSLLSVLMLVYFAIPKITAQPVSLKGFKQFGEVLGLDPLSFMLFTGYTELLIAIAITVALFLGAKRHWLTLLSFGTLLGTMGSGLLIEFFVRPEPKILLVVIASIFSLISLVQIYLKRRYIPFIKQA